MSESDMKEVQLVDTDDNGIPDELRVNLKWLWSRVALLIGCVVSLVTSCVVMMAGL